MMTVAVCVNHRKVQLETRQYGDLIFCTDRTISFGLYKKLKLPGDFYFLYKPNDIALQWWHDSVGQS